MKKQILINALNGAAKLLKKHSPEILTGIGIVGMIATTVTAVRATPKALELIDEREIEEKKRLSNVEVVQTTWKCYIPAAVTGALSVACLIGASSVNLHRNAALATAYTISEAALKEYREKTVEIVGPKKEQAIRDAIVQEHIDKNPVSKSEVIVTGSGETRCYDVLFGRYFKCDRNKIERAVNELNRRMLTDQFVSLNEFYYEIGLPGTKIGDELGWNIEKGYIDIQFGSHLSEDGTPCLAIAYTVGPQYGYNVLGLHY